MAEAIYYVYGVTPPTLDLKESPEGLDGATLELETEGPLAALLSRLDPAAYAPDVVERRAADVEWVGPRAVVHDRVLTWVSDQIQVVPFPMFSAMFRDTAGVRAMLRDRVTPLQKGLEVAAMGREYGLRLYRDETTLVAELSSLSPRIADLERTAAAAAPGQRYLLERKLDGERKVEMRRISESVARETYEALANHSVRARRIPMPRAAVEEWAALALNAVFLVAPETYTSFRSALGQLGSRFEPAGFRFEFSGPWPAYHFMDDASNVA